MLSFFNFLLFSVAALRPPRLDHFTIHIATDTIAISFGYVNSSGATVWLTMGGSNPPASPSYYVSSTGSDAATQPGTLALPLATPQEACRRLAISGWTGSAFVILVDTINLGANPECVVPAPTGSALPICWQTTYANAVTGIACTGGTQHGVVNPTPATFTSADGSALNTQRGNILKVTSGPLAGTRAIIDTNNGAGTFSVSQYLLATPGVGNTFDILTRSGKLTWSGQFTVFVTDCLFLDGVEMLPTGAAASFMKIGGTMVENATRWVAGAAQQFIQQDGGDWQACGARYPYGVGATTITWVPQPTGVTPCGCRYDGALLGSFPFGFGSGTGGFPQPQTPSSWEFTACSFQSCEPAAVVGSVMTLYTCQMLSSSLICLNVNSNLNVTSVQITSGRRSTTYPSNTSGIIGATIFGVANATFVSFVTPAAADDLLDVSNFGAMIASGVSGTAGAAGKLFLKLGTGGRAISSGSANTATGGTVGTDIAVDGGVGFAVAQFATYGALTSGQSGSTFTSTTDNSASPSHASTVNKMSGREAIAIGGGAVFTITNSLARGASGGLPADSCFIQLESNDATAKAPIAVVTDNTITITFSAAATAATTFSWLLKKATVN